MHMCNIHIHTVFYNYSVLCIQITVLYNVLQNEYGAYEDNENGTVSVTITHLPPNSDLTFQIAVINKRRYGTQAPVSGLLVTTKEGGTLCLVSP